MISTNETETDLLLAEVASLRADLTAMLSAYGGEEVNAKDYVYQVLSAIGDSITFTHKNMEGAERSGLEEEARDWRQRWEEATVIRNRVIALTTDNPAVGRGGSSK